MEARAAGGEAVEGAWCVGGLQGQESPQLMGSHLISIRISWSSELGAYAIHVPITSQTSGSDHRIGLGSNHPPESHRKWEVHSTGPPRHRSTMRAGIGAPLPFWPGFIRVYSCSMPNQGSRERYMSSAQRWVRTRTVRLS